MGSWKLVILSFSHSVIQSLINQLAVSNPQLAIHSFNYQSLGSWLWAVGNLFIQSFSNSITYQSVGSKQSAVGNSFNHSSPLGQAYSHTFIQSIIPFSRRFAEAINHSVFATLRRDQQSSILQRSANFYSEIEENGCETKTAVIKCS